MISIDNTRCTGCGSCADLCPQQAITMNDGLPIINDDLCYQCGTCIEVCPAGAIRETVPARAEMAKGGERMMYGYGRGFGYGSGGGYGRGFGFRGSSPPWPYVGRGRGGLPRCWHPGLWGGAVPYGTVPTRDEELGFLKEQSNVMKREMEEIERRIQELEKKE